MKHNALKSQLRIALFLIPLFAVPKFNLAIDLFDNNAKVPFVEDSIKEKKKNTNTSAELWKNEPFAYQDLSKEIIGKRDANAKHFQKADGSISAHIAAGDIHYKENNEWKTIYHTISPTSNGFENVHNSHKTYYPATATGSLKTVLKNGKEMRDMIDMNMYFTVNGNKVQVRNIQNTSGNANFNKLTYPNVYGNGIDLELTQETSVRKMDYVIHSLQALGNIPNNACHLVFEETVELPTGWTAQLVDNKILLKDASGKVQASYDKPYLEDAPTSLVNVPQENQEEAAESLEDLQDLGEYSINQTGRLLTIKTAVTINWLTSAERVFPLKVDPTVNVSPVAATDWVKSMNSAGTTITPEGTFGRVGTEDVRAHIKFNTSSIPAASTINSVDGTITIDNYNNSWNGQWEFSNSADPTSTSGTTLYNSANTSYSSSGTITVYNNYSLAFNVTGENYVETNLINNFIHIGVRPVGTYSNNQYYKFDPYSANFKPYLTIDFDAPSVDCNNSLTNLTATIGTPENGINHYLRLDWDVFTNALAYDVQSSTDGTNYTSNLASVSNNFSSLNMGDTPDTEYWLRVRAKDATTECSWESVGPIRTAPDNPAAPVLSNAITNALDLTIPAEIPQENPNHTTYSIYCSTTSQYLQAGGTLGATDVWQTKATWGTINVTGLSLGNEYCFYLKAKNGDGHIVGDGNPQTSCITITSAPAPIFHDFHTIGFDHQLAFNNSRMKKDDTLNFNLSHGGIAVSEYEIEINTNSDFSGTAITESFTGVFPPYTEKLFRFEAANGLLNSNNTTYYVRARVKDGTNVGAWTTRTYSFTYNSSIAHTEWYQQTTPQFLTDELNEIETSNDEVYLPSSSGSVDEYSFETVNAWSAFSNEAHYVASQSDGNSVGNMPTHGSNTISLSNEIPIEILGYGGYTNNDFVGVAQQIDLTLTNEIIVDIAALHESFCWTAWWGTEYTTGVNKSLMQLDVIIGTPGSITNNSGISLGTYHLPSQPCDEAEWLDQVFDVSGYTGLYTIKFVASVTNSASTQSTGDVARFYIDNIRTQTDKLGTIYSQPFNLNSIPVLSQNLTELFWTQDLNGSMVFDIQYYNTGTSLWQSISGFDNIEVTTTGLGSHFHPLTGIPFYDSVRIKATLLGSNTMKLHDWGLRVFADAPLPVELKSLTAECNDGKTEIDWTTESEQNSDRFEIEKSRDGEFWINIGEKQAAGNSNSEINYNFTHNNPTTEITYYRLKQIDFDGNEEVFGPISSQCKPSENTMIAYPNPNNGEFTIEIESSEKHSDVTLLLTDMTAKTIDSRIINVAAGTNQIMMNNLNLQKGAYMVKILDADMQLKSVKVIVN